MQNSWYTFSMFVAEVAGVTLSNPNSAPVPKFLNPDPGPEVFQNWESDPVQIPIAIDALKNTNGFT